jgi:uncharacterized membrane protein
MAIETAESQTTATRQSGGQEGRRNQYGGATIDRVATGLGWFSIGLGFAEVIAPRAMARLVGSRNHSALMRFFGIREIAAGVAILKSSNPAPGLWARVGGDMVDLAFLASVLGARRTNKDRAIGATIAVAGVTALDILAAQRTSSEQGGIWKPARARAEANLMINQTPEECYRFWRNFENMPRFMSYVQSVRITGERRSHWVAKTPGDVRIEWDSEVMEDIPNQRIAWRSLPGSDVTHSGSVDFDRAPGNRGTIVRVQADYGNAAHALASAIAKLMGKDPEQIAYKDLRRFKQLIETGEIITTEGQPAGRSSSTTWLDNIAR